KIRRLKDADDAPGRATALDPPEPSSPQHGRLAAQPDGSHGPRQRAGRAVRGATIYLAEAGPVPHLPGTGTVVSFGPKPATATEVAAGSPLLVDVEFGRGRTLYALSQSTGSGGPRGRPRCPARAPGQAHRGRPLHRRHRSPRPADLARVHRHTAYVVTLGGRSGRSTAPPAPCGAARQATTDPEAAVGALDK